MVFLHRLNVIVLNYSLEDFELSFTEVRFVKGILDISGKVTDILF